MPRLVPQKEDFEQVAKEILAPQVISKAGEVLDVAKDLDAASGMSQRLDEVGLTREQIAWELKQLAMGSQKEEIKHAVLKTALQLHGELKDQEVKAGISITFVGAAPDIMSILMPR